MNWTLLLDAETHANVHLGNPLLHCVLLASMSKVSALCCQRGKLNRSQNLVVGQNNILLPKHHNEIWKVCLCPLGRVTKYCQGKTFPKEKGMFLDKKSSSIDAFT